MSENIEGDSDEEMPIEIERITQYVNVTLGMTCMTVYLNKKVDIRLH
jgi:hypothetical protein